MMIARSPALTLAACGLLCAALAAQTWTHLTPTPTPGLRRDCGMEFDPLNGVTLVYGGLASPTAILNENWTFDGTNWNQLTLASPPPARWGHRMVYDSHRNVIVTYGGRSPTITATANDTWEWNGTAWSQVFPIATPGARAFYSMAFDERRGRTVMFGSMSPLNGGQTWEYNGATWAQVVTSPSPVSRETPAMAYDRGRGVTVLFGGYNANSPGTMYGDTWEYDGATWHQVTTAHSPAPRYRAACVYDQARGRVVMYGGFGSATFVDTWEYDGNDWTQVLPNGGPPKSTESAIAYDPLHQLIYHFGGSSAAGISNEIWSYSGPFTALFAPFGRGGTGSGGVPTFQAVSLPVIGQTFTLDVINLPPAAYFTTLLLGAGNQSWLGNPLPLDLGVFGLTGNSLEVDFDTLIQIPAFGGSAQISAAIPAVPVLAGFAFYLQSYTDDPLGPNGIGTAGRAGHGVMGN